MLPHPQCTPIKIHRNLKNVKEISKLSCVEDFKRKFQLDCMFPSSAGVKRMEKQGKKEFIKQNEVSLFSV